MCGKYAIHYHSLNHVQLKDQFLNFIANLVGNLKTLGKIQGQIQTYGKGGQNEPRHYISWFGKVRPKKRSQPTDNSYLPHQPPIYC